MTVFVAVIAGVTFALFLAACVKIERLHQRLDWLHHADHDACVAFMARFVGDQHTAAVLEAHATYVDSPRGHHDLTVTGRSWVPNGPSVHARLLRERAAKIREEAVDVRRPPLTDS